MAYVKTVYTNTIDSPDLDATNLNKSEQGIADAHAMLEPLVRGSVTGTATFTKTTNNINLTGIGSIGLEIGDVITVSGSTNNNKEFTVEMLGDADNLVVNYEHRNGTSSKSLIQETKAGVTVKLLAKWFNAPVGLGQGWLSVKASRGLVSVYTNLTGRPLHVGADIVRSSGVVDMHIAVGGVEVARHMHAGAGYNVVNFSIVVPKGTTYSANASIDSGGTVAVGSWAELR